MLPTFFVIGAAKCGTTSLHYYLGCHPQIHMSPVKEPCFFLEDDPARPLPWRVGRRDAYERLFESEAAVRGESSTTYSQYPWWSGVPERIHALVPQAKLVYLVGDPVYTTVSHYLQHATGAGERRPLLEALGDIEASGNRYTSARRYATQIEQYLRHFPASKLLVVDQEELRSDRRRTLAEVFAFLEVDSDFTSPDFDVVHNTTRHHRSLTGGYRRLRGGPARTLVRRLPEGLRAPVVARTRRVLSRPAPEWPALDDATRQRLTAVYEPEVDRLRAMTGKAFASWSL